MFVVLNTPAVAVPVPSVGLGFKKAAQDVAATLSKNATPDPLESSVYSVELPPSASLRDAVDAVSISTLPVNALVPSTYAHADSSTPSVVSAFRLSTRVVEATVNGAVPVATVLSKALAVTSPLKFPIADATAAR